jgi:membrane protease YdiL (CAAX protease family)
VSGAPLRLFAVLLALSVSAAAGFGLHGVSPGPALFAALAALFLLLVPYFFLGLLHRTAPPSPASLLWAPALLVPYGIYAAGTGAFSGAALLRLALYAGLPALAVHLGRERKGPGVLDLLAVLVIWLPFDLRLLENIWVWPEGQGAYGLQTVMAVDLAVLLFVLVRGFEGIGYRFELSRAGAREVLVSFVLFSAAAIPLGLGIDFIRYDPDPFDAVELIGSFLAILLFIGIPEELLFRGLIQNFLDQWLGKGWTSLLLASAVFGAAHLDNDQPPNFAYALMATIAGLFYGRAFRRTGGLMAPALVHALVDTVWRAVFR